MSDQPSASEAGNDGRPHLVGRIGSLDGFWPLILAVLEELRPERVCEIGVDKGIFTDRLLAWGKSNGCRYVGVDPAPGVAVAERVAAGEGHRLILGRSLDVLPGLEPCGAYFIDGDHNYFTVRGEFEAIAATAVQCEPGTGPVIFAHDVSWPWARRDMYHCANDVPAEARHPASAELGVSLDGDELVAGGIRSPGRYSIAFRAGGPRNGVLAGIEDFLAREGGTGWRFILVPMGYGLGILYRPESVPERCRERLDAIGAAVGTLGDFLESAEANYLRLYLYAEEMTAQAEALRPIEGAYRALESTYGSLKDDYLALDVSYHTLETQYEALSKHSGALLTDYNKLLAAYHDLEQKFRAVGAERDELRQRPGNDG